MNKIIRILALCMVLLLGSLLLVACDLNAVNEEDTTVSNETVASSDESKPADGAVNQAPETKPADEATTENTPEEGVPAESTPAEEATTENTPDEATTENTPEEPVVIVPMEPTEIADDDYEDKTVAKHPSLDKNYYILYKQLTAPANGMIGVSLTLFDKDGTELQSVEFYFENGGKDGEAKDVERIIWKSDKTLEIHMADSAKTVFNMADTRS